MLSANEQPLSGARAGAATSPARRSGSFHIEIASRPVEIDLGVISGAHLKGALDLVDVPGVGRRRPLATPAEIEAAEREHARWAISVGLVQDGTRYFEKYKKSQLAALAAYTLPDVDLERSRWFLHLQAFIFTLDDALDNQIDIRAGGDPMEYAALALVFDAFLAALSSGEKRRSPVPFPAFEGFREALLAVRRGALETGLDIDWLVASMRDYFDALAWEHGAHTARGYLPTVSTYVHNREQTISYLQSIESFLLIKGISLAPAHRERHPVRLLLTNACRHVLLVNDVFSLAKEIDCGEVENVLLLGHARGAGSLARRFDTLLSQINDLVRDTAHVAQKLAATFPGDRDVQGFIATIVNSVNGHVAWYAKSRRYGHFVRAPRVEGIDHDTAATAAAS
jgi:hypothetical protein